MKYGTLSASIRAWRSPIVIALSIVLAAGLAIGVPVGLAPHAHAVPAAAGASNPSAVSAASQLPLAPPASCRPFPDVTAANLHCANIAWLAQQGITMPIGGLYQPDAHVNRGSMAAFLYRLANPGKPGPRCTAAPFPDVPKDHLFCGHISWAASNGIAFGYDDGSFRPDAPVTRGAMAAFLRRIVIPHTAAPACTTRPYTDVAVGDQFCGVIAWAKAAGVTHGSGSGKTYAVTAPTTRAAMATFLRRMDGLGTGMRIEYQGLAADRARLQVAWTWNPMDRHATRVEVEVTKAGSGAPQIYTARADARQLTTGKLDAQAKYRLRFRVVTAAGAGPWSAPENRVLPRAAGLPVLTIATDDPNAMIAKDPYRPGSYELDISGVAGSGSGSATGFAPAAGALEIKGRGNSTWLQPKKPYRLKLSAKTDLLGLGSSKHWVLLADSLDDTFLRNRVALGLGQTVAANGHLGWTPGIEPVELILNGEYLGLYYLVEQVRIDKGRLDIGSDQHSVTQGPYYIELDQYVNSRDGNIFRTRHAVNPFLIRKPEVLTPAQRAYIENYVNSVEDAIFGHDGFATPGDPQAGYKSLIDSASFADWYLVEELTADVDAWAASTKMHKTANSSGSGVLRMGPLWDFDLSGGQNSSNKELFAPTEWAARGPRSKNRAKNWFTQLFADPVFEELVHDHWAEHLADFQAVVDSIPGWAAQIRIASENDYLLWGSRAGAYTFPDEVATLHDWYQQRINWLTGEFGS